MRNIRIILLLALAVVTVAGCTAPGPAATPTAPVSTPTAPASTPTAPAATPTAQAPQAASVTVTGFSFKPDTVTIARGGTVAWTNEDATTHTIKFVDSESPGLQKGGTYSKKFDTPGTFDYVCGIHTYMHGTVIVT